MYWRLLSNSGVEERVAVAVNVSASPSVQQPTAAKVLFDRSGVKVTILNASGVKGAAAVLAEKIKGLGYEQVTIGNTSLVEGNGGLKVLLSRDLIDQKTEVETDLARISKVETINVSDSGEKILEIKILAE